VSANPADYNKGAEKEGFASVKPLLKEEPNKQKGGKKKKEDRKERMSRTDEKMEGGADADAPGAGHANGYVRDRVPCQ
jgi:hypothetical protein